MQVGSEFAVSTVEQQLQIRALRTLNACLTALTVDESGRYEGELTFKECLKAEVLLAS